MNIATILHYGQKDIEKACAKVPVDKITKPGACGEWSVHDILAHLVSYEHYMNEVVMTLIYPKAKTPILDTMAQGHDSFNKNEVTSRKSVSFEDLQKELKVAHEELLENLGKISSGKLRKTNTLPWYGGEYALDDYLIYTGYGHKKEHAAQIAAFA